MALIGKIRERMGYILVIFVGFALFAFVLGDILTSNTSLFKDSKNEIGRIGGESVGPQEFEAKYQKTVENHKAQYKQENIDAATADNLRDQTWMLMISEKVFDKVYDNLGITVSTDELWDMVQGRFVHPKIMEVPAFKDSLTGRFKPAEVVRYLNNIKDDAAANGQWLAFESGIKKERLSQKYYNMVKGGLYVTKAEAQDEDIQKTRAASILYFSVNYRTIPDSSVSVTEAELKAYLNAHPNEFKQEASRKAEYVVFDVNPSQEDYRNAEMAAKAASDEFSKTQKDSEFVMQNSDSKQYNPAFVTPKSLPAEIEAQALASAPGAIVGPYLDRTSFRLIKVLETKEMPDSVKARHILLRINPGEDTLAIKARVDSIRKAIKGPKKFEELATKYSQDPGSAKKGGDLGWFREGMMVKPFNDACFFGKKGDITVVQSNFGYHIIEIMDQGAKSKRVKTISIDKKVEVSTKTDRQVYGQVNAFASQTTSKESFDKAVETQKLTKRVADNIKENDRTIAGLDQPREMIRWAYKAKTGEVSKIFQFGEKYVVAVLTDIHEKGVGTVEQEKSKIEPLVRREKKAKLLSDKIAGLMSSDLNAVAGKLGVAIQNASNVTFANAYFGDVSNEPEVVGTIASMKKGQVSKPIAGKQGVYVVSVLDVMEAPAKTDYTPNKMSLMNNLKQRSDGQVFNALKEKADIVDNRGKFY